MDKALAMYEASWDRIADSDSGRDRFFERFYESFIGLSAEVRALFRRPHAYLAISGGGANGAFGAGLLAGWTASGTRPVSADANATSSPPPT